MSIEVYNDTKIYIACPANVATGGPESLHQLGYHFINDLNVPASMYYYNFDNSKFKNPVHPEYEFYKVPYITDQQDIEDDRVNILIVPEILDGLIQLKKYKKIRKGIWFLSVDNYYLSKLIKEKLINKHLLFNFPLEKYLNKLDKLAKKYDYKKDDLLKLADFYMTSSFRGLEWFKDLNQLYFLSRYINPEFLKMQTDLSKKEDIVAYNPAKGLNFTKKIMSKAKYIKFVPISNMTREEVIKTLLRAKVYIDFGHFPGPERIPKEAAI
ncbi:MAG: hypothetical protein ACP5P7_07235, partial [Sulfurihydrogenibium sp.]